MEVHKFEKKRGGGGEKEREGAGERERQTDRQTEGEESKPTLPKAEVLREP